MFKKSFSFNSLHLRFVINRIYIKLLNILIQEKSLMSYNILIKFYNCFLYIFFFPFYNHLWKVKREILNKWRLFFGPPNAFFILNENMIAFNAINPDINLARHLWRKGRVKQYFSNTNQMIYEKQWFSLVSMVNGKSAGVGYLMPKSSLEKGKGDTI